MDGMAEDPLVGGGSHRQRAHLGDELRVARLLDVAELEQPLERVVRRRDEAVEAGGPPRPAREEDRLPLL
jgi:hypothetical protein